jgi:hypothetical protein
MNVIYGIMDIIKKLRFYHSEKEKIVNIICPLVTHLCIAFLAWTWLGLSLFDMLLMTGRGSET